MIVNGVVIDRQWEEEGERLEGKRKRKEAGRDEERREAGGERNQRVRGRGIRHCQP